MTAPSETKPAPESKAQRQTRSTGTASKPTKTRPAKMSEKALREALVKLYSGVGMVLAFPTIGLSSTAETVVESAETCADAWIVAASANDKIWFALQRMVSGGAMGAVFFAHLPIIMAAAAELAARRQVAPTMYVNEQGQPVDANGNLL